MAKLVGLIVFLGLIAYASAGTWLVTTTYDGNCKPQLITNYNLGLCYSSGSTSATYECDGSDTFTIKSYQNSDCSGSADTASSSLDGLSDCTGADSGSVTVQCKSSASTTGNLVGSFYMNDDCSGEVLGTYRTTLFDCGDASDSQKGCFTGVVFPVEGVSASYGICTGNNGGGGSSGAAGLVASFAAMLVALLAFAAF